MLGAMKDSNELAVGDADDADEVANDNETSNDSHVTSNGDIAETVRQNSKQKLAGLAFKADSEP